MGNTQKKERKAWVKKQWCLPRKAHGEFVFHREDVLAVYQRPYDPRFPQGCLDEWSKQLLKDKRARVPMRPGDVEKDETEYEREGGCQICVASEPLAGQRVLQVRERRTKKDWAEFVRELIDVHSPQAEKLVLVMDNLNTHSPASCYEAFEPAEAWRLSQQLEIHAPPVHGSWLNMAEIELSVLARQALGERMPSIQVVPEQVRAWQQERNHAQATINWRLTAEDARIKLKRLYPSLKETHLSIEP